MADSYLSQHGGRLKTPQDERAREDQVENDAGGFVFELDPWARLRRFLILGSEGGTYYAGEAKLTRDNVENLRKCIGENPERVMGEITDISEAGRAPSNDPALFALAMLSVDAWSPALRDTIKRVARIGTHLFHFLEFRKQLGGGWGSGFRRAIQHWYLDRPVLDIVHQLVKYQQRDGWAHRDALLLGHVKPDTAERDMAFCWSVKGELRGHTDEDSPLGLIVGHRAIQGAKTKREACELIRRYGLTREMIPTEWLRDREVWEALLLAMPIGALLRNLSNLSKCGLLQDGNWETVETIGSRLKDPEELQRGKVHPLAILVAAQTYAQGTGMRSDATWPVCAQTVEDLNEAFVAAFGAVEPMGGRVYIGVDVSGSMDWGGVCGSPVSPRVAAAALALVTHRTENRCLVRGFSHSMVDIGIGRTTSLGSLAKKISQLPMGRTDCAMPMLDAGQRKINVDVFITLTDNETWCGHIHPFQALREYRKRSGINAKMVVLGMTSTGFSIGDPRDGGCLDVVGMDTATPALISAFAKGEV